jgi:hypothetical protein
MTGRPTGSIGKVKAKKLTVKKETLKDLKTKNSERVKGGMYPNTRTCDWNCTVTRFIAGC